MNGVEAEEVIAGQFATAWNVAHSFVPFQLENESFDPPADGSWLRVSIQPATRVQETMNSPGLRKFLSVGTIFVQVFTPLDAGTKPNRLLCEAVKECLEALSLSGGELRTYASATRAIGPDDKWFASNVSTTYEFNETR